jgi:hypothetical protein
MKKLSLSVKIYIALVIVLSILTAINAFMPQGDFDLPDQESPIPKPVILMVNAAIMLVLYGGLGFIGLKISQKLAFADILDDRVSAKQRLLFPALLGVGIGLFFIVTDSLLSQFHPLGSLPHPPFPSSLLVSASAAIGEEIIFRLFFIPFGVWLISYVILKKRWQEQVFWIVAILSALAFSFGHLPSVMVIFGISGITEIPPVLMLEIMLLNGVLTLFAAYYFRKYGFLAAVGIHFWVDVVWHVVWGGL